MDLNTILAIVALATPFCVGGVWMTSLAIKTSNRALVLETAKTTHEDRLDKLEAATSYTSIEKIVERVCAHVFHSPEFKASMKESIEGIVQKSIRDTILHLDKNKKSSEVGAYAEILDRLKGLRQDQDSNL